jgi:dolichyl-phosphate-mannose-protein mannosyltransferase
MAPKGNAKAETPETLAHESKSPVFTGQHTRLDKPDDYTSDGVADNDIFLLPGSDFQVLGVLTILAAVVRLFRIYQPSSVVFDEVQYAHRPLEVEL